MKTRRGWGGIIVPFAAYGMQVVACGVPLLSMYAPYELFSEADIYETYRACAVFFDMAAEIGDYVQLTCFRWMFPSLVRHNICASIA